MGEAMRSVWLVGVLSATLACSEAVSSSDASGGTGGADSVAATGAGTPDGGGTPSACPPAAGFGAGTAEGEPSPDFTLVDCDGTERKLSELMCGKKVALIEFGAGWCQPCREAQPEIQKWQDAYGDKGLVVLEILRENKGPNDPATKAFCKEWRDTDYHLRGIHVTIDPTDKYTTAQLSGGQLPVYLVVDATGTIKLKETGTVAASLKEDVIKALLGL